MTGAGLDEALDGVDAVVDAANAQGRSMHDVLVAGTRRVAKAGVRTGVTHHVLISIIGIDTVPVGYYAAKLAQEAALDAVAGPGLARTVLRATQFHPLLNRAFSAASRVGVLPTGRLALQPVDPAEVAGVLVDVIERGPGSGRIEFAGPEIVSLGELAQQWASARGARRLPIPVPPIGRTVRALRAGALTSVTALRGQVTFADWLHREYAGHG
jgi:nucleoside-diphosphate-sugar epimerase